MTVAFDLLGGAERRKTRARGFAPWNPQPAAQALLVLVQAVLTEYAEYLPLTIRQVFYRLVGVHGFEKTERAYERLCENLNRARRARLIPMDTIRDDGGQTVTPSAWEGAEDFLSVVRAQAAGLVLDRTAGQPTRLIVMCEAAGMVPQLARVAEPYGVPVISSGGFESVTDKHDLALDLADDGRLTEVLGGVVKFTRLAVTPKQIGKLGLATAPPKETDRRAFNGETCQAEAIPPDVLAAILGDAIEARIDRRALDRVLKREKQTRRELKSRLQAR